jgi:hypothetical protein
MNGSDEHRVAGGAGLPERRTGGNFVAITAKAAWEDVARSRFRCRDSRGVVLTSGAVHYCGPGYMHSVLRAVRPTPHPHLAVRNAALGGAAFSVAGLAVEASRASRDGRDRLEWALTRRTAVTRGGYPGQPVGWPRELHQHLRIRLLDGVVVAIVKIRGHEGAVPFCDVDVTLCDVDGGGVDV